MFERILVPTDGSGRAERALPYAVELAARFDATLFPMYVVDTNAIGHALGAEQADRLEAGHFGEMTELHERAASAIERARERIDERADALEADVAVDPVIEAGVPHRMIAEFAEENDVDLVVMTSQGRGGVARAILGSVTERVARNTTTPVLVVDAADDSPADPEAELEPETA